jgi:hypothetical protein
MTNYDIENELRQNLNSNEKFIWTGKPKSGIVFRGSDIFFIPFSFLWFGMALFMTIGAFVSGAPLAFAFPSSLFVLVGLYISIGRFLVDAKKRAKTVYGITPERIIIKSGIFRTEVKSLYIRTLSNISLIQKSDNSGTITFGQTDFRHSFMSGMEWPGVNQPPILEFIENVKNIYDKIIELQRQTK